MIAVVLLPITALANGPQIAHWLQANKQLAVRGMTELCYSGRFGQVTGRWDAHTAYTIDQLDKYDAEKAKDRASVIAARAPGSSINCTSQTGSVNWPTETHYFEAGRLVRSELREYGGTIIIEWPASQYDNSSTITFQGVAGSMSISSDAVGLASVTSLSIARATAMKNNKYSSARGQYDISDSILVNAANEMWRRAPGLSPLMIIHGLMADPEIQDKFLQFATSEKQLSN
jgi:hypothetical protein